ncbi:MAG: hypothetical protein ACLGIC_10295 [Acidimicrobiia bacterium]
MHPYIHELTVPVIQAERRRQAPARRPARPRLVRRTGAGLVAVGTALAATGRRLQEPAPGAAACATC